MLDENDRRLGAYLSAKVDGFGGLEDVRRFTGGQSNPTFLLTTASRQYVLRRRPPGTLLKSAHAVDREYRLLRALEPSDVPVPRALHYCDDPKVLGSEFYVMEFVDGVVHWDASLADMPPEIRSAIIVAMVDTLASLHQVDWAGAGLADFGRHSGYAGRQIARWTRQYRDSAPEADERADLLIAWLGQNVPDDDGMSSIVHGDFRIDNLLYRPGGSDVLAVIDWELATIGHPLADLAYMIMHHRLSHDGPFKGLGGIDRSAHRLPSETDIIARYAAKRGLGQVGRLPFWIALSTFRLYAVLAGVAARIEAGNAADPERGRTLVAAMPELLDIGLSATSEAG